MTVPLTEEQRDALQELMNISMGQAANALARLINAKITLSIPKIVLVSTGEFQRIFPDIKLEGRQKAVIRAAERAQCVVLLKGAETCIAAPDGSYLVNRHASPWLATAGSGDVLTGLICGLLAQGVPSFDAAAIATWLHGDIGVRAGPGLTADSMIGYIPLVLRGCLHDASGHVSGSRT